MDRNPEEVKIRNAMFNEIKAFTPANIADTAADELGIENFFFQNKEFPTSIAATYRELVRQAFNRNKDKSSAIDYANKKMRKTHGNTEVGFARENSYMFMPVEKVFPDVPSEVLTQILQEENAALLPEGIDASRLSIQSSEEQTARSAFPTWMVTYVDDAGRENLLINPATGQPREWTPAGSDLMQRLQQEKTDSLKAASASFRQGDE